MHGQYIWSLWGLFMMGGESYTYAGVAGWKLHSTLKESHIAKWQSEAMLTLLRHILPRWRSNKRCTSGYCGSGGVCITLVHSYHRGPEELEDRTKAWSQPLVSLNYYFVVSIFWMSSSILCAVMPSLESTLCHIRHTLCDSKVKQLRAEIYASSSSARNWPQKVSS